MVLKTPHNTPLVPQTRPHMVGFVSKVTAHSELRVTGTPAVLLPTKKMAGEIRVITVYTQAETGLNYIHKELVSMHWSHPLLVKYLKSRLMTLFLGSTTM